MVGNNANTKNVILMQNEMISRKPAKPNAPLENGLAAATTSDDKKPQNSPAPYNAINHELNPASCKRRTIKEIHGTSTAR